MNQIPERFLNLSTILAKDQKKRSRVLLNLCENAAAIYDLALFARISLIEDDGNLIHADELRGVSRIQTLFAAARAWRNSTRKWCLLHVKHFDRLGRSRELESMTHRDYQPLKRFLAEINADSGGILIVVSDISETRLDMSLRQRVDEVWR